MISAVTSHYIQNVGQKREAVGGEHDHAILANLLYPYTKPSVIFLPHMTITFFSESEMSNNILYVVLTFLRYGDLL